MQSERLLVYTELFEHNPIDYIRSLIGDEVTNLTYTVNDVILPDSRIVVDVTYEKLLAPTLKTIWVQVNGLKRLGAENGKYIFEYNKTPVCLVILNSEWQNFHDEKQLPVSISPYTRKDAVYNYIARIMMSRVRVPNTLEPLHAYSTIISSDYNLDKVHAALKEAETGKVKEMYDEKETIEAYQMEIANFEILVNINNIKVIKDFNQTKNSDAHTGFVMSYTVLPDAEINGHIIIVDHRRSDLLFYYPNNSNMIYQDEIEFIKEFMKFDHSNLPKE